jgi:hypothetical protein
MKGIQNRQNLLRIIGQNNNDVAVLAHSEEKTAG